MAEVHIVLSDEHAHAVKGALDLYSRLSMGQIEELEQLVLMGEIKPAKAARGAHDDTKVDLDLARRIRPYCDQIKQELGHNVNGSFGIGHPDVSKDAHRCYEVKKVLAKALAVHRNPDPGAFRGVDYDGLWRRFADGPEPRADVKP